MKHISLVFLLLALVAAVPISHAAYIVTAINTTVSLNYNTSAQVVEVLRVSVTNQSVNQYTTDRLALNLTLQQWQGLVGPSLVEHIVNPHGSIYDFNFLPGPLLNSNNGRIGYLVMTYSVSNVSTVKETGPRTFLYSFNPNVFNYQNALSGQVLGQNTTLQIILPQNSKIDHIVPEPDSPSVGFIQGYKNVTSVTWNNDESLSSFALTYTVTQSLQDEVISFFAGVYNQLGVTIVALLIIVAIAFFIVYTYFRAQK